MSPQRDPPVPSTTDASDRWEPPEYRRRSVVVGGAGAIVTTLGGCTTLVDLAASFVLEDVNVLNEAGDPVRGALTIADATGDAVLEAPFDLVPTDAGPGAQAIYDDVWSGAGEYEATVELEGGVEGKPSATESVTVSDPDDEHLVISLGNDALAAAISFHVVDRFSDLSEDLE